MNTAINIMMKFMCTVALFLVTVKANDEKTIPYGLFTIKTAYKLVSAPKIDKLDDCEPRQIFMLARHGARGPRFKFSTKAIPELLNYKTKFTKDAKLREDHIEAIKNWETIIDTDGDKSMTQKGLDVMKELAISVREAFPNLFQKQYDSGSYEFLTASDTRCVLSGEIFLQNLFKDESITNIPVCDPKDIILSIEGLKKANKGKNEEMETYYFNEIEEFRTGKHMAEVVQRVAEKMGIDAKELGHDVVNTMYEVATFEMSIDDSKVSPWYNVFCPEDLEIFEYAVELFRYYFNGYGDPFNAKLACPMAIRLEETLGKKINGQGPDGAFYFGHTSNVLSLYVMLGIGKDDPPFTSSNYKGMEGLKWRTSFFGPWAANVMVVLYEDAENKYYVAFYFNEKLTSVKLTDGSLCTKCPWSGIQDKLTAFINENDCIAFVAQNNNNTA